MTFSGRCPQISRSHVSHMSPISLLLIISNSFVGNSFREAATGVQLKAKSRTFVFVDLVGVDRDVVKDMAGIKSNHCFVTAGGFIL